jgi:nucleoside-diphosphate-sugar epimerase
MKVFVAGASGAIGQPLIAELIRKGHTVTGMTHSEAGAKRLRGYGVEVAIANALETVPCRRRCVPRTRRWSSMNSQLYRRPRRSFRRMRRVIASCASRAETICTVLLLPLRAPLHPAVEWILS